MLEVRNLHFGYSKMKKVLDDFSITFNSGNIYALIGANGAGKSTLVKIISGELMPQFGQIFVNNKADVIHSPKTAIKNGIVRISQEFNLIDNLSIADNIFISDQANNSSFFYNKKRSNTFAEVALSMFEMDIDVNQKICKTNNSYFPFISFAKALIHKPQVLILDETTAMLNEIEVSTLFKQINVLKKEGTIIIFVTHKLDEVVKYADNVVVLRNGKLVLNDKVEKINQEILSGAMIGNKKIKKTSIIDKKVIKSEPLLKIEKYSSDSINNFSFEIQSGEVLGLISKSKTELDSIINLIFGIDKDNNGKVFKDGNLLKIKSPKDAIENNIGYITDDKKIAGLFYNMSISDNINFLKLQNYTKLGILNRKKLNQISIQKVKEFEIVSESPEQKLIELSGGNQQKVLFSKWFVEDFDILILNEPTAGIDIKGKYEVYKLIDEFKNKGKSFILISSEWNEIKTICDKIIIISNGRIKKHFYKREFDEHEIYEHTL